MTGESGTGGAWQDQGGAPAPARPFAELPQAAQRALREAAERRAKEGNEPARPPEVDGRDGPEPVRYGDWERRGLISDF